MRMSKVLIAVLLAGSVFFSGVAGCLAGSGKGAVPGQPAGGFRDMEVSLKAASSKAVLAYLRAPGQGTLRAALRTCLDARERLSADMLNDFLIAFCRHEQGDAAAESKALSGYPPEAKNTYRYIFYEHRPELADALYLLPAYMCAKLRETSRAGEYFPAGARCPSFGGPITSSSYKRGGRVLRRFSCAECDGMLGLGGKKALGNLLLRARDNTLNSLLIQVAHGLDDRRSFEGEKVDIVPRLLSILGLKPGQVVGDIGCGIGQFTFPVGRLVGQNGRVYAEDVDVNAVNLVKYCVQKGALKNVVPVLGGLTDTGIPAGSLDTALLFHVYRGIVKEFDAAQAEPFLDGFFASVRKTLKEDGTLVLVDNVDPAFDVTAVKVTEALRRRGFKLAADKSDARIHRLVLLFRLAAPAGPKEKTLL